jgi:hypothetical protein
MWKGSLSAEDLSHKSFPNMHSWKQMFNANIVNRNWNDSLLYFAVIFRISSIYIWLLFGNYISTTAFSPNHTCTFKNVAYIIDFLAREYIVYFDPNFIALPIQGVVYPVLRNRIFKHAFRRYAQLYAWRSFRC